MFPLIVFLYVSNDVSKEWRRKQYFRREGVVLAWVILQGRVLNWDICVKGLLG